MRRMPTSKGVALIDAMADLVSVDGSTVTFGGDVEIDGQSIADNELNLGTTESSSGTLTASQLSFLQNNPDAYITMAGEKYYLAMNSSSGYMNYSCVDYANSAPLIKTITITVSTKAWVLSSQIVGKRVYCHPIVVFQNTGSVTLATSIFIFNQSSEPINTYDKLKAAFASICDTYSLSNLNIVATGKTHSSSSEIVLSHMYYIRSTNAIQCYGLNQDGVYSPQEITNLTPTVVDGVNPIN